MDKQLYIQTDNPNYPYAFWLRNILIRWCDDEDYLDTVNELSAQGYTFINRV